MVLWIRQFWFVYYEWLKLERSNLHILHITLPAAFVLLEQLQPCASNMLYSFGKIQTTKTMMIFVTLWASRRSLDVKRSSATTTCTLGSSASAEFEFHLLSHRLFHQAPIGGRPGPVGPASPASLKGLWLIFWSPPKQWRRWQVPGGSVYARTSFAQLLYIVHVALCNNQQPALYMLSSKKNILYMLHCNRTLLP